MPCTTGLSGLKVVPVSDVGSLQDSQGSQHLKQQIPDDLLSLGLLPQGPPPGTGLHHRDPLQCDFVSLC